MPDKVIICSFPASEQARFKAWTKSLSAENTLQCQKIVQAWALNTLRKAKSMAPSGKVKGKGGSRLRATLHHAYTSDKMNAKVYVEANYGPFQEWGTGKYVKVPDFVLQDFGVDARDWKGAGLRDVNLKPQPYLFENARVEREVMFKRLEEMGFKRK